MQDEPCHREEDLWGGDSFLQREIIRWEGEWRRGTLYTV